MCVECKKKQRVVEIHHPRIETTNISAPCAPKKYLNNLKKEMGMK